MKKALALLISLICLFTAGTVSALSTDYEIDGLKFSLSNNYVVSTKENLTASSSVEGLVFVAISKDGKHQIQARAGVTDFSEQLISFSGLNEEDLAPVGQKLFPDGYQTSEINGQIYFKCSYESDSMVYVTVANKKLYTFTYFGDDFTKLSELVGSITLPEGEKANNLSVVIIVVLLIIIALIIAFLVLIVFSFVKDYRHKKMEQDKNIVSQYIKIKRRKY